MKNPDMMLHAEGNKLKNVRGEEVRLLGVNRAGLEWASEDDDILSSVCYACDEWKANVVRLPLAQSRWFGFADEQQENGDIDGEKYRQLVDSLVEALYDRGKYAILDLHWNDMNQWGDAIGQHRMADTNSLLFWKDLAKRYKNHPAVIFDLYNEPMGIDWETWKNGGYITETFSDKSHVSKDKDKETTRTYHTPGMQKIADTIRAVGAKNLLMISGLDWGYWLEGIDQGYAIDDKGGNGILYDTHVYPWKPLDWDAHTTLIADRYPIIIGEFGHYGDAAAPREGKQVLTSDEWLHRILSWIDEHNYHFTAWDFHPHAGPCLIQSFNNEPTEFFGVYIQDFLRSHNQ